MHAHASGTLPPDARDELQAFAVSPRELRADRNEFLVLPKTSGSRLVTTRAIADVVRAARSGQPVR